MTSLDIRLAAALASRPADLPRVCSAAPTDRAERLRALIMIYDAQTGPVAGDAGPQARLVTHPAVAALRWRLESQWLDELSERSGVVDSIPESHATEGMRALVGQDSHDAMYRWLASHSSSEQLLHFLASDGYADDRLEDVIAATMVGLDPPAMPALAMLLAEEIGAPDHVDAYAASRGPLGLDRPVELGELSPAALERVALPKLLRSSHWLQPEALGYLTMRALQSGPRAARVLHGLKRHRAPSEAIAFYRQRAVRADESWGNRWVTEVVRPAAKVHPDWSHRIIRGARWRLSINDAFYGELYQQLRGSAAAARRAA